jgi:hypothetical protein
MIKLPRFLRISVTTFFSIVLISSIFGQEKIAKEIHETYPVNNNSLLSITNKYGNIDIRNWDKQSIDVVVQIVLKGITDKQSENILNSISINYNTQGGKIIFETVIDDNLNNSIFKINNGSKKFEVNYIVNMPHTVPVDLHNKYGNIFIDKLSAPSTIEVKYGNLKANDIQSESKEPLTQVILGYSEGNIELCSWLKIIIKYSKVHIEESKALIFVSKYSKIFVERGSSIVTESKYDEYNVGTIANFVTESSYSNFAFKSIGKKLQTETSYSDVKVGFVPAGFELIKVSNRYGSYKIGIEENASYTIKGYCKYGDIIYPDEGRINRIQENSELTIEGLVGKDENTDAQVVLESKYGSIKLVD